MNTPALIATILAVSVLPASAAVESESSAYQVGSLIGLVLLGGMIALVVINTLRKKGILTSNQEKPAREREGGRDPLKIFAVIALLVVAAYVISYLPRRSSGEYKFTKSGEIRSERGIIIEDIQQWSPQGCWWQHTFKEADGNYRSKGNGMGFFYAPLIAIDRQFNYPDQKLNRG